MSAARRVYIVRHGERLDFVDPHWRSTATRPDDPPLTSCGERQAQDLGRRLRDLNIASVYTSSFARCVRTAVMAANEVDPSSFLKVRVEPGLCEWLNALWYQGTEKGPVWMPMDELKAGPGTVNGSCKLDAEYQPVRKMDFNFEGYPETWAQHLDRCASVVRHLLDNDSNDGNILLVGHGTSVAALFVALCPGQTINNVTCKLYRCVTTERKLKKGLK